MGCSSFDVKEAKEDEIIIEYNLEENQIDIKLFDEFFVNNNKSKCKIIVEGKDYELQENFYL